MDKEDIEILEDFIKDYEATIDPLEQSAYFEEVPAKTIKNLINKYKELETMVELMAKDIEKITGSCPFDMHDYQVEDCDNICQTLADNGQQYTCFIEYYEKKAKGE